MYFCFFATLGKVFAKPRKNIAFRAKKFFKFYEILLIFQHKYAIKNRGKAFFYVSPR